MAHAILISADCHAAVKSDGQGSNPHDAEMRRYVSPGYREAYDAWLEERPRMGAEVVARMGNELFADVDERDNVVRRDFRIKAQDDDIAGTAGWDPQRRIQELESDGVVADIIYPNGVPFQVAFNTRGVSAELELEGVRAYNRWLAEFCSYSPERHAGCAVLQVSDVGEAVNDVDWAWRHGLRAVFLDPMADGGPHYNHPCYEPLWRACAERAMPVVFHSSPLTPFDYGPYPGSTAIFTYETTWFAHRPFWFICCGGVLERYPGLKVLFAEQGETWAPAMLAELDLRAGAGVLGRAAVRHMKLKPSEYWYRQCALTTTGSIAVGLRHATGVDNIMWGTDYPHMEGSYPNSVTVLKKSLAGIPADEAVKMIGGNAVRFFNFDLAKLQQVADRVGPELSDLIAA